MYIFKFYFQTNVDTYLANIILPTNTRSPYLLYSYVYISKFHFQTNVDIW